MQFKTIFQTPFVIQVKVFKKCEFEIIKLSKFSFGLFLDQMFGNILDKNVNRI